MSSDNSGRSGSGVERISIKGLHYSRDEDGGSLESRVKDALNCHQNCNIESIVWTPQKGGVVVSESRDSGSRLVLMGMEDRNNPKYEYTISQDDRGHAKYQNIQMLGNGKISYITWSYPQNRNVKVIYNYFDKEEISSEPVGGGYNDASYSRDSITPSIVKNRISKKYDTDKYVRVVGDVILTPSKYGAIAIESGPGFRELVLYGLEDLQNPKREYAIFSSDDDGIIKNVKILGNGVVEFDVYERVGRYTKHIKYDYFHKRVLSKSDDKDENHEGNNSEINIDKIKRLIKNKLGGYGHSVTVYLTPSKQGAIVADNGFANHYLWLYGLENPNNPIQEHKIDSANNSSSFSDVKFLGNGIITYTKKFRDWDPPHLVTQHIKYDYFHKKIISNDTIGNDDNWFVLRDRVKNELKKTHSQATFDVYLTPSKHGAIVSVVGDFGSSLELWGLDDPNHPKFEYIISMDDLGHAKYRDIQMLGNGKISYITKSYVATGSGGNKDVKIVYDYFNKKRISLTQLDEDDSEDWHQWDD